jgi:hypothetical protein
MKIYSIVIITYPPAEEMLETLKLASPTVDVTMHLQTADYQLFQREVEDLILDDNQEDFTFEEELK